MDLIASLLSPPPSLPSAVMIRKCPNCRSRIEPYHINLDEVTFMCTQCMFPFEEDDITKFFFPKAVLSFFEDFKSKKKRTSSEISNSAPKKQKIEHQNQSEQNTKQSPKKQLEKNLPHSVKQTGIQNVNRHDPNTEKQKTSSTSDKPILKTAPPITTSFVNTLEKLKLGGWFTDEVINAYFALLGRRYPRTGFMSSYFTVSENAKNWSTTQSIVEDFQTGKLDQIAFPYHIPGHWTLALIKQDGSFFILDSLGQILPEPIEITKWLQSRFSDRNWKFNLPFHFPLQQDSIHCGAFICFFAELASQNKSFQLIAQSSLALDIQKYRVSILDQLLNEATGKVENFPIVIPDDGKSNESPIIISEMEENGKSEASSPDMQPESIDLPLPKEKQYHFPLGGLEPSYGIFGSLNRFLFK